MSAPICPHRTPPNLCDDCAEGQAIVAEQRAEAHMNMVMSGHFDSGGICPAGEDPRDYEECEHGLSPFACRACNE